MPCSALFFGNALLFDDGLSLNFSAQSESSLYLVAAESSCTRKSGIDERSTASVHILVKIEMMHATSSKWFFTSTTKFGQKCRSLPSPSAFAKIFLHYSSSLWYLRKVLSVSESNWSIFDSTSFSCLGSFCTSKCVWLAAVCFSCRRHRRGFRVHVVASLDVKNLIYWHVTRYLCFLYVWNFDILVTA